MHSGRTRIQWWVRSRTIKCLFLNITSPFLKIPLLCTVEIWGPSITYSIANLASTILQEFSKIYIYLLSRAFQGFSFFLFKKRKRNWKWVTTANLYIVVWWGVITLYITVLWEILDVTNSLAIRETWSFYCSTAFEMSKVLRGSTSYNTLIWTGFYSYRNIHEELDNNTIIIIVAVAVRDHAWR
jgi:hypothetical protein